MLILQKHLMGCQTADADLNVLKNGNKMLTGIFEHQLHL